MPHLAEAHGRPSGDTGTLVPSLFRSIHTVEQLRQKADTVEADFKATAALPAALRRIASYFVVACPSSGQSVMLRVNCRVLMQCKRQKSGLFSLFLPFFCILAIFNGSKQEVGSPYICTCWMRVSGAWSWKVCIALARCYCGARRRYGVTAPQLLLLCGTGEVFSRARC